MAEPKWHPSNRLPEFWADPKFRRQWHTKHEPNPAAQVLRSERDEIQRWFTGIEDSLKQYKRRIMKVINESSLNGVWATNIRKDILKYRDRAAEHEAEELTRGQLIENSSIAEISQLIFQDPTRLAHTQRFKNLASRLRSQSSLNFTKNDLVTLLLNLKQDELKSTN